MTIDREDIEALALAIRKGTGAETFEDQLSEIVDPTDPENRAAYARTPEGRAERSAAALIAQQDLRYDAAEAGVAVGDDGLPLEEVTAEDLEARIEEMRREVNALAGNPERFETLNFELQRMITQKTTIALTEHLRERREEREDELAELQADREDEDFGTETF